MQTDFFKENKDVFDVLFEAASEGIIIVNSKQSIISANTAAAQMFGYEPQELVGNSLNILIPSNYRAAHPHHFHNFMENSEKRQMGHGRDLYGVRKDGSEFPVEAGLNPFNVGEERYIMSLVIDITVRKENQQEIKELNTQLEDKIKIRTGELQESVKKLQRLNLDLKGEVQKRKAAEKKIKKALQKEKELNELKTKFLSLVSHEFKTPLSGILSSATLAEKYIKEEQQDKRERHLGTIRNKVRYLNNILNDFLSIERLETGNNQYKYTSFSLKRLINELVYNANITLKNGQEIIYPKDIGDVMLYQDEKVLELILSNLLGNSIKYSPEDTLIKFNVIIGKNAIIFEIEDQGIGIPENDQKHIFERYFRAENAVLNQGTGIGLNIAKTHLENLGGSMSFTSKENVGTKFIVEIPILSL